MTRRNQRMTDKKIISLQVTEDRRKKWGKAVEQSPETGTLSGFIRGAVEARINGPTNGENGHAGDSEALNEILEAIQETNSRLGDLEGRVSTVEGLVRGEPEIEELADRVFGVLPAKRDLRPLDIDRRAGGETVVVTDSITDWGQESDQDEVPIGDLSDSQLARSGHVLGLAELVGESPYNVEKALEELMDETYVVDTGQRNGDTVYFREE